MEGIIAWNIFLLVCFNLTLSINVTLVSMSEPGKIGFEPVKYKQLYKDLMYKYV